MGRLNVINFWVFFFGDSETLFIGMNGFVDDDTVDFSVMPTITDCKGHVVKFGDDFDWGVKLREALYLLVHMSICIF